MTAQHAAVHEDLEDVIVDRPQALRLLRCQLHSGELMEVGLDALHEYIEIHMPRCCRNGRARP